MKTAEEWQNGLAAAIHSGTEGALIRFVETIMADSLLSKRQGYTEAAEIASHGVKVSGLDGFAIKDAVRDAILAARDRLKG